MVFQANDGARGTTVFVFVVRCDYPLLQWLLHDGLL